MTLNTKKQLSFKLLIMYMISTLLFLSSTELHIHTHEAAAIADHGSAFSFTSLADKLVSVDTSEEINISPDGMLVQQHSSPSILAVFILVALLVAIFRTVAVRRPRDKYYVLAPSFFNTPSLRAPPK
jgi:hypothetical protein